MELNEIRKFLYKEDPIANLNGISKDGIRYSLSIENKLNDNTHTIMFLIPFDDIGEAIFSSKEHAKYLIRWIIPNSNIPYNY